MAGGKETPRQKMIGMMYLVLTALLALNVSKSILDAFVAIEENMQQANLTELARGNEKLFDLKEVKTDKTNPGAQAKATMLLKAIEEIDKWTGDEIKRIDDIKLEILKDIGEDIETVGGEKSVITTMYDSKEPLLPTRMNLQHVNGKDKYDDAMRILIGPETNLKKPTGKGQVIWDAILAYRNKLTEKIASTQVATDTTGKVNFVKKYKYKAPDIKEFENQTDLGKKLKADIKKQKTVNEDDITEIIEVYRGLTKKEFHDFHGKKGVHWVGKTFDHSPSVAAIASLTSLQKDILSARARALGVIRARVGGGEYSFNKVMPLAYGPEVVNANEEFEMKIMMAAFDTDKQPKVTVDGEEVKDVRDGQGFVKRKLSSTKEITGTVAIQKKNGDWTKRTWRKTVQVMKPSGSIELPEMNVLYIGYPNKVNATASGYPETVLSASGATTKRSGDGYIVSPNKGKSATLTVSGKTGDGKVVRLKSLDFRVSILPNPDIYWGGARSGEKASKTAPTLFAKYGPETPLKASFKVVRWECSVPGAARPIKGTGNKVGAAAGLLRAAPAGSQVSFICYVVGPDGLQRKRAGAFTI